MDGQINWRLSVRASAFHALKCIWQKRTIRDQPLSMLLSPIIQRMKTMHLPQMALDELIPQSALVAHNSQLASTVLERFQGAPDFAVVRHQHLEQLIGEAESAILDLHPNLREDLRIRMRPLREQWEARGPGFLAAFGKFHQIRIAPKTTNVVLVYPIQGGAGSVHRQQNAISIEAVLTNEFFELPEVVRMGWLIAQLGIEDHHCPLRLLPWACLPACLAAAEEVELARCDKRTMELALDAWHIDTEDAYNLVSVLSDWWNSVRMEEYSWLDGIKILQQRLGIES